MNRLLSFALLLTGFFFTMTGEAMACDQCNSGQLLMLPLLILPPFTLLVLLLSFTSDKLKKSRKACGYFWLILVTYLLFHFSPPLIRFALEDVHDLQIDAWKLQWTLQKIIDLFLFPSFFLALALFSFAFKKLKRFRKIAVYCWLGLAAGFGLVSFNDNIHNNFLLEDTKTTAKEVKTFKYENGLCAVCRGSNCLSCHTEVTTEDSEKYSEHQLYKMLKEREKYSLNYGEGPFADAKHPARNETAPPLSYLLNLILFFFPFLVFFLSFISERLRKYCEASGFYIFGFSIYWLFELMMNYHT